MNLAATETLVMDADIHYFCTLVCREALNQFHLLSIDVENTENLNVDSYIYIKSLAVHFYLLINFQNKSAL